MSTAVLSSTPKKSLPRPRLSTGWVGAILLAVIAVPCFVTLPWSLTRYDEQRSDQVEKILAPPSWAEPMGTDDLGRSLLWRSLLGGAISLGIGISAALIAVFIGVIWGAMAGYAGGKTDAAMMRTVDVLYGLPYILLVVMVSIALQPFVEALIGTTLGFSEVVAGNVSGIVTLLVAIGGVSWLTMSRVIRGQVLSLRNQPFIEATKAVGMGTTRVFRLHLLPNLIGVIVVYATLAVPLAILQESFLSFLGIGVRKPLPSWGSLASEGIKELPSLAGMTVDWGVLLMPWRWFSELYPPAITTELPFRWWLLVFPCTLLGLTLMGLNFLGDALRDKFDPKRNQR
ncbi:MAG: ABC transporter permease [Planctomycetota bacterium]